jgi:hypothetical protein
MCSLRPSLAIVILLSAACQPDASGPAGPSEPPRGVIAVSVATQGDSLDPDGYLVVVSKNAATGTEYTRSVGGVGELTFSSVAPGQHYVSLENLAQHCKLQDRALATQRVAVVSAGETTTVAFGVVCSTKTPGRLRLSVSTTFSRAATIDEMAIGFSLLIDGQAAGSIRPNGLIELDQFPAGVHTVTLKTNGCLVNSGPGALFSETASIRMPPGGFAQVKFNVWCGP